MLRKYSIVFFLLFSLASFAQKSTELVKINGVKYYVHTVQKGHTLYAISKVYSVDIVNIINANPGIDSGLSIGQELLIPKNDIDKKEAKQNPPKLIDGKLIHTVAAKETLYGISSKYKISVEELVRQNPEVAEGLKVGMELVINQTTIEEVSQEDIKPALPENYIEHVVKEKETLYSISKIYSIGIDSIVSINPTLIDGLKIGMVLYIPKTEQEYIKQQQDEGLIYSVEYKDTYNIALFLPFNLIETDTIILNHQLNMKPLDFSQNTMVSVEFYRGFLMALDSLKKQGLKANIFVYDLGNDASMAKKYISEGSLDKMDLLIGPFHFSTFIFLADFAHQHKIKIVCPIDHPNRIMLKKPEVIESTPSQTTQIRFIAEFFKAEQDSFRTISVFGDEARSKIISDEFKKHTYENNIKARHLLLDPSFKPKEPKEGEEVINPQFEYLINTLDSNKVNRIFIASANDAFIIPLFNSMNGVDTNIYKIQAYGLNALHSADQINNYYRHKFKLTLALTNFVDYSNPKIITFIKEYRNLYNTDPSASGFAMRGFDNGHYFLNQLLGYGLNFEMVFSQSRNESGLQMKFNFKNVEMESGYENQDMYLVRYHDYNMINLPTAIDLTETIKVEEEIEIEDSEMQEIDEHSPDE
jgi:LysM repeat protein